MKKSTRRRKLKVALVCDWLTNVGGAEKVLLELHRMFPQAPIYTSQYLEQGIDWFRGAEIRTGWLNHLPASLRRFLGPFRQLWFSRLDLSDYDLVISVTGAEAKAVKTDNPRTGHRAVHLSYCHVPTQYYWQMYDEYVKNPGFGVLNPFVRFWFKVLVKPLRRADFKAAGRVDQFITTSKYAAELIQKYYQREALVIWPPVEVADFQKFAEPDSSNKKFNKLLEEFGLTSGEFYVTTSRQVTWKRLDLAIKACLRLGRPLAIIGEGPEHAELVKLAGGSELIKFLPLMGKEELGFMLSSARGYLFPSMEPFGIAPVEAISAGCPVIAFREGGARDYVVDGKNGVFFDKQTVKSMVEAMRRFEELKFKPEKVAKTVEKFALERFEEEIWRVIDEATE